MRRVQPVLEQRDRDAIRAFFAERLTDPVTIELFTQRPSPLVLPGRDCPSCADTQQVLEEVAELSDHVTLDVKDFWDDREAAESVGIGRIPAFVLRGQARGAVRFFGAPAGYEFSVLLEDLPAVASGDSALGAPTREALGALAEDVHIQVFSTPG